LEAAAMGKAIVSTHLGAEGLDFSPDREIVLADQPDAFARAVIDLLNEPVRRETMGRAARARVVAQYSLPVLQRAVRIALANLVELSATQGVTAAARP
jgi:glycosyltransferase involved in cell wall biosynthesis